MINCYSNFLTGPKAQRQSAKAVNFGLIYGMSPAGLASYAAASFKHPMTEAEAKQAHAAFFKAYPGVAAWHRRMRLLGYGDCIVRTPCGLMRDFKIEPNGFNRRAAYNTPVQGSGAEALMKSLTLLPNYLAGLDARIVHHMHDEVILEVADRDIEPAKVALDKAMTEGFLWEFPPACSRGVVDAHAGKNWEEAKP